MIRVVKPEAPSVLTERGTVRVAEHQRDFLADRAAFEAGTRTFSFDRDIYASAEVRTALSRAQHDKCCFCEQKIEAGDVEHFRPKAAARSARHAPLERPGYYWLAYTWSNLYYACASCNQRNKESLFPLRDPSARVRSHEQADQVANERPLFIDPGVDDPERFIEFNENQPRARDDNPRGHATIFALELGRVFLMERRLERFTMTSSILDLLEIAKSSSSSPPAKLEKLARLLASWTRDDADFTSMTRCNIRARFGEDVRMPLHHQNLLAFARGDALPTISATTG